MFPTTVPHVDTVRLSLAHAEARSFYRDMIRQDIAAGNKDEAAAGLWVYLDALAAFEKVSGLVRIPAEEMRHRLLAADNLSEESMLQILAYLDSDQIPVPVVTTYIEQTSKAA